MKINVIKDNKLFFIFLMFVSVLFFSIAINHDNFIFSDGMHYYRYLPEIFINGSLGNYNKYPFGTAILMFPFFVAAHIFSPVFNFEANGYTKLYQYSVLFAAIFYYLVGTIFVYKSLAKFYSKRIALFVCIFLTSGTMLPYYVVNYSSFSHIYAYFINSVFVYLTILFHSENSEKLWTWKYDVMLGFLLGFAVIIRNLNGIIVVFYVLYSIKNKKILIQKFQLDRLFRNFCGFILPVGLYGLYLKHIGRINSYAGENFLYLKNPKILEVLFSDAKGLFIFSPILFVAVLGFFYERKNYEQESLLPSIIILSLTIYFYASWWCWWLGGAYSIRIFCDYLILFAIPLGAFLSYIFQKDFFIFTKKITLCVKFVVVVICICFCINNISFIHSCNAGKMSNNLSNWYELKSSLQKTYTLDSDAMLKLKKGKNYFSASNSMFYSQFSKPDDGGKAVSQGEGWLLFGPYKRIKKGEYTVTFIYHYVGDDEKDILGFADINSNSTPIKGCEQIEINRNSDYVSIDFNIEKSCKDFETRVFSFVEGLVVDNVIIERIK